MPVVDYYETVTEPSTFPITLDETKNYLKIQHSVEDDLLDGLIASSTNVLENYLNRWFISRDAVGNFDTVQFSRYETFPFIEVKKSPLNTVSLVQVRTGETFVDLTVDDDYMVKQNYGFDRVIFYSDLDTDYEYTYPIRIEFNAGFGTAAQVPDAIKTAIKMYINFLYSNRGDCMPDCAATGGRFAGTDYRMIPREISVLIDKYRIIRTFA